MFECNYIIKYWPVASNFENLTHEESCEINRKYGLPPGSLESADCTDLPKILDVLAEQDIITYNQLNPCRV